MLSHYHNGESANSKWLDEMRKIAAEELPVRIQKVGRVVRLVVYDRSGEPLPVTTREPTWRQMSWKRAIRLAEMVKP